MSDAQVQIQIVLPMDEIKAFCQKWQITEFTLFGSVLRDDFRPDSDIDVLVTFAPESQRTLFQLVTMKEEIEAIFGRKVDLVNHRSIERSHNYIRRKAILNTARTVYVT